MLRGDRIRRLPLPGAVRRGIDLTSRRLGGPARRRVVGVLALVLALDSADKATIAAAATQLQSALHIGTTQLGLLLAITSLVGAVATVPFGALVDRVDRTRLLGVAVVFWGVAMLVSGAATSFLFLVVARCGLGIVTAVAAPAVASLLGDYFQPEERGRIYGYVLAGELVGAGFGFVVSGLLAAVSWRASVWVLVVPAAVIARLVSRLPEPARGGASRIPVGAARIPAASATAPVDAARESAGAGSDLPLWPAVRYVLRVPTNVVLIVGSVLGYFFFTGISGFGVQFVKRQYGIGQAAASSLALLLGVGAIAGALSAGRVADRWQRRGHATARVTVAGCLVLMTALVFVPTLLAMSLALAIPLLMVASALMGGINPPLDAARLDIMPPRLWGRAEAVRSLLRDSAQAAAPLVFGYLAEHVFGGRTGLRDTFLVMLVPLVVAAGIVLTVGRRTYPRDVARANAATRRSERVGGPVSDGLRGASGSPAPETAVEGRGRPGT